jgi:hypothetical protein
MDLRKLKHLNLSIFHWTLVLPPFHKGCLTFFKIYIQIITNLRQAWRNRGSVNLASEFFFVRSQLGGTKSEQRTVSLRSPDSWSVKLGQGKMGKKNLLDGTKGNHMLLFCPKKQTRCLWGRRREMVQRKKMLSTHARAITERPTVILQKQWHLCAVTEEVWWSIYTKINKMVPEAWSSHIRYMLH